MKIIESNKTEMNMHEIYDLTRSPEALKLSDHTDEVIDIANWAVYEDVNQEGSEVVLLTIQTPEGEIFTTNSETFRKEFLSIVDLAKNCGETFERVKVGSGTSKNGRSYITAILA